ncbi:MAG: hypothetical protein IT289_05400 [Oligoflexia bacterium]|nr:hypothetical protein [Oligoflexia bacterium]
MALLLMSILGIESLFLGSAAQGAEILTIGESLRLPTKGCHRLVVTQSKPVKVIEESGYATFIAHQIGRTQVICVPRKRVTEIWVYSQALGDLHKSAQSILRNHPHIVVVPKEKSLLIEGQLESLSDWRAIQKLRRQNTKHLDLQIRFSNYLQDLLQAELGKADTLGKLGLGLSFGSEGMPILTGSQEASRSGLLKKTAAQWNLESSVNNHGSFFRPMIETEITLAEIKRSYLSEVGFKWPGSYSTTVIPTVGSGAQISFESIRLLLNAESAQTVGRVIASPRLVCLSGESAEFLAGGEIPIRSGRWKNSEVQWKKHGIILKLSPRASLNGIVSTRILTEVSLLDRSQPNGDTPGLQTNRVETHFNLNENRTLILSGLIRSEIGRDHSKFPGLGDIPVLGELFKSQRYAKQLTELVVFVTPRILKENQISQPEQPSWMNDEL